MKKLLAFTLAMAMVLSMTACSSAGSSSEAAVQKFTAGTYEGVGRGLDGEIKVSVTFSDTEITDIKVLESNDTRLVSQPALDMMPERIIEAQSLAVDMVSSVTFTSRGVVEAVKDACRQAGGNMDLLTAKLDVAKAEDETIETDVVVVGLGLTGVTASMSALDEGAKVVALEKASVAGGSSKLSGGFITAVNSNIQKDYGYELSIDDYMAYYNVSEDTSEKKDETDRDEVRAMIERSASDIKFLEEHGVPINKEPTGFGGPMLIWHFPATRTNAFDGYAAGADHIDAGIRFLDGKENFTAYYNTTAEELIVEDGKVVGVVATRKDGSKLTVKAGAVVLATGGFAASKELMAEYCPDFPQEWVLPYTTSAMTSTGDGMIMAKNIGAALFDEMWWMDIAVEVEPDGHQTYVGDTFNQVINYANYFVVDGNGTRAFSTTGLYGPRSIGMAKAYNETGVVYSIFTPDVSTIPAWIEEKGKVDGDQVIKADTIAELCEKTGMDEATLTAQIDRWNAQCDAGLDEDYGQTNFTKVLEGPYYAVKVKTSTMGTIGGLKTDSNNRVLSTDGTPIEGLYAGGELINGKYFNQVYMSGCAQLLCTDSGILAGSQAAKAALK
ncbi:MAG: FAD-dependent oxidoreductase [Oscillospiraceae bacterium]|nr:FAD-dependent oxidoreductase [Oscillospiraceae bacterium]